MKLSEAIRAGAALRPQGFGTYFRDGRSCALGAACEGAGIPYVDTRKYEVEDGLYERLAELFPALAQEMEGYHPYSVFAPTKRVLASTLFDLNDRYKLTREQIADWLEERGL